MSEASTTPARWVPHMARPAVEYPATMNTAPPARPRAPTPRRPRVSATLPARKMPMAAGVLVHNVNRVMPDAV